MSEIEPLTEARVSLLLQLILQPGGDSQRSKRDRLVSVGAWALAIVLALIAAPAVHWFNRPAKQSDISSLMLAPRVPIYLTHVPEDLYLENNNGMMAQVTLRAPNKEEDALSSNPNFGISIDLKDYPAGTSTVTLTSRMIAPLPAGWQVERYNPEQVRITLVRARSAELPVVAHCIGLPKGFQVLSVLPTPGVLPVRIKDDRSLSGLNLATLPVDLTGIHKPGTYTYWVGLDLPPAVQPQGRAASIVRVVVQVGR